MAALFTARAEGEAVINIGVSGRHNQTVPSKKQGRADRRNLRNHQAHRFQDHARRQLVGNEASRRLGIPFASWTFRLRLRLK
jgi:uncharacterized protein (UPF0210 family)